MSLKDKSSSQQQNNAKGNRMSLKSRIYLTAVMMIVTAMGTVLVLQRLGLIVGKVPSPSPSPTITSISPIPPTPQSPTITSESPTLPTPQSPIPSPPSNTNSPDSSGTSSPGVLYTATKCLSDTPGVNIDQMLHSPNNSQITIGKEFVSEIANISTYYNQLTPQPFEFVCNLHSSYKELRLVFGVNDAHPYAQPSNKIDLQVLLDKKPAETRQITVGTKQTLVLNLQDKNTVALRVSCTSTCPPLSFTEMGLK